MEDRKTSNKLSLPVSKMNKIIKDNWFIILAGVMLLLAIPNGVFPYSYYQILRWVVTIVALYSAYSAYKTKNTKWTVIMVIVAVLFNPIAPIYFAKETWQVLDFITSGVFFVSLKK